jgi:molecular chaperone DnaK
MVADAEVNAEEDKARVELVGAKNTAEAMIHSIKKTLEEHGKNLDDSEKQKIEEAIKETESALTSEDKEVIESKTKILTEVSQKLSELAMAQTQKPDSEDQTAKEDSSADENAKKTDDVVDADFKEVKRD